MVEPLNTQAWVLVPADPTTEMVGAATRVDFDNEDEVAMTMNLWHAMVAAAPDHIPEAGKMVLVPREPTDVACAECAAARQNAKEAGHRDWATGVCFDHAGLSLDEWLSSQPAAFRREIDSLAIRFQALSEGEQP